MLLSTDNDSSSKLRPDKEMAVEEPHVADRPRWHKGKSKQDNKDCLNLRKTFLGTSPRLVILKSAEELCLKKFDFGNSEKRQNKSRIPADSGLGNRLLGRDKNSAADRSPLPGPTPGPSFCYLYLTTATAALVTVFALLSFFWTPFDLLMNERLKMVRGLPAYEWWANPPDEVLLRVYLFNITNAEEFLSIAGAKLKMEEIGPFIFREKLRHTAVKFNKNGTLTYTAHRTAIFLPEMNHLSLNATLTIPNLAVLGMSSYLWDATFLHKIALNMLQHRFDSKPLMNTTVYNYLWNLTDPLLKTTHQFLPATVPTDNMGVLHQIYKDFVDEVTVYMGPGSERKFFTVNQFHGSPRFGYWKNETCDSVDGATEGVTYHQFISKNDSLRYLRKTICRVTPLKFSRELIKMGMLAYKFELPPNIFSRPEDKSTEECFISPGLPELPSGLTDVSPCYFHFPIAASFPHFLNAEKSVQESIIGLSPDKEKHSSFVIVEPITGVPMESRARSQSNLVIRQVNSFPRVNRFNDTIIPMFWAEYNQVGLPWYIVSSMYLTVNILLVTQTYFSCFFFVIGLIFLIRMAFVMLKRTNCSSRNMEFYTSLTCIPQEAKR